jgi:hypothetical protein
MGEPSLTPAIYVPWTCLRPSLTQRAVAQEGELARAGRTRRHSLLHPLERAPLHIELPVGMLCDQPRRARSLLADLLRRRPTELIHDLVQSVAVLCGQSAPCRLRVRVIAVRLGCRLVIRRSHAREFRRQSGHILRHSQLPGHVGAL